MAKVFEFLAEGFEEIEALAPVDILRRGGVDVKTVSISSSEWVTSSHGVTVKADLVFGSPADYADADLLMLPGGLPGSTNLNAHDGVRRALLDQYERGRRVAAICAAPMVFGSLGILRGKRATCSPGFEKYLDGAEYTAELVTVDGNIITGKGPAASLPYAYTLLSLFVGEDQGRQLQVGMLYAQLMGWQ